MLTETQDNEEIIVRVAALAGFETWLDGAKDVRHLPGRPKTGKLDAVWLCKVAGRQMLRPSFVPSPQFRRLRDVTRYHADLVGVRTAEKQRAEKLPKTRRSSWAWSPRTSSGSPVGRCWPL